MKLIANMILAVIVAGAACTLIYKAYSGIGQAIANVVTHIQ